MNINLNDSEGQRSVAVVEALSHRPIPTVTFSFSFSFSVGALESVGTVDLNKG